MICGYSVQPSLEVRHCTHFALLNGPTVTKVACRCDLIHLIDNAIHFLLQGIFLYFNSLFEVCCHLQLCL